MTTLTLDSTIDTSRYPLHLRGSSRLNKLISRSKHQLSHAGFINLPGFIRQNKIHAISAQLIPVLRTKSFTHCREHNIYFCDTVADLPHDHPVNRKFQTINHTICADQITNTLIVQLYEWEPLINFIAAVMGKSKLHPMHDRLARVNVMAYRDGEALNWHFDRSEFTTTLLLQAPLSGGEFEFAQDLRSDSDPNYTAVGRLLNGEEKTTVMPLEEGTLNIFKGKNTAHRVTPVQGNKDRIITVFSYFDKPGVCFSCDEKLGFYGRAN